MEAEVVADRLGDIPGFRRIWADFLLGSSRARGAIDAIGRLHEVKRFKPGGVRLRDEAGSGLCADWKDYLSGLLTAEGSLSIARNGPSLAPRAQVLLRSDDIVLLEELQARTGLGRVNGPFATRGTSSPAAGWFVRDRVDIAASAWKRSEKL